ncbi:MAG: ABC transporter permease [Ignavibacteriaceae bacterium]
MKTILNLIKKDYILFWHDKPAVSLTFLVPIILIYIFGSIFSGGGSPQGIRMAFINSSNASVAKKIETALDTSSSFKIIKSYINDKGKEVKFDTNSVKDFIRRGNASAALIIPEDAYTDTSTSLRLKFYYDPKNAIEMQMIQGLLQQTIMTEIPSVFTASMQRKAESYLGMEKGSSFNRQIASVISKYYNVDTSEILHGMKYSFSDSVGSDSSRKAGNFFSNILQMDKEQLVGANVTSPDATRSVGGWAVMFLLFTITGASTSLFDESKSGVILRILSSPISRVQILWSKYLYNISLGCIQLFVLFFMGYLLFNINIFSNFLNLVLMIIAASAASTAFGMLLAAFCKTAAQASGLGTFLILTMSAVGGAWFPTFILPPFIQIISKLTIVYWAVDGFLKVLWNGYGFMDILPYLGVLIGIAVVVNLVSLWKFKRGTIL